MAERIETILRRALRADRRVAAAYLFGSAAAGRGGPASDVDVAVLLGARSAARAFDVAIELRGRLEGLARRPVDLVVLNTADPFLRFQVYSKGRRLFERSRRVARGFLARSLVEYWDYAPWQKKFEEVSVRRLLSHGR